MDCTILIGEMEVSGLWTCPTKPERALVLAHSAGRDMRESFLEGLTESLAERSVASLRFQFPHVERGEDRPRSVDELYDAVEAAVAEAGRRAPGLPLFAGGKSLGGRISSQLSARGRLPGIRGVLLLGFPLHPEGQPSSERTEHLDDVQAPMLFVQGEDDAIASLDALRPRLAELGPAASLLEVAEVNHGYEPRDGSSRTSADIEKEVADGIVSWMGRVLSP